MSKEMKLVRVLEHEKGSDQIRIGFTFPTRDLEETGKQVLREYDEKLGWCGGIDPGMNRYYVRVCLVDSVSLAVLKVVWENTQI